MSDSSTDRILSVIDAGLQTPVPDPTYGEVSPKSHDRCARCEHHEPAEDGDLCGGCRAFLLGDSDTDPKDGQWISDEQWAACVTEDGPMDQFVAGVGALTEAVRQFGVNAAQALNNVLANLPESVLRDAAEMQEANARYLATAEAFAIDRDRADELLEEEADELDDPSAEWRVSFERATDRLYKLASHGEPGPSGAPGVMWRFVVDHTGLVPQEWQAHVMAEFHANRRTQ